MNFQLFVFFAAIILVFCAAWLLNQYAAQVDALEAENASLEEHNQMLWDENLHLKDYFDTYSIEDE